MQNSPATFVGTAQGAQPIDYAWDWGDTGTGAGQSVEHTYTGYGSFVVTMTASNVCGQASLQKKVTVQPQHSMHVVAIRMRYKVGPIQYGLMGVMAIYDLSHVPVDGAGVRGRWTLPDNSVFVQQRLTDPGGVAKFTLTSPLTGTYQFCVVGVAKTGWVYVSSRNHISCQTLTVP